MTFTPLLAATLLIPGIIPMPDRYYDYAPIGGHVSQSVYASPIFQQALSACGAPQPGYGIINAPADPSVKCMDAYGFILVESFRPPRQ